MAEIYGAPEPVPGNRIIGAADNMVIDAGQGLKLKVIETLGHAAHHLSFYSSVHKGVFTGDAAGIYLDEADSVIPTTPPPFRLELALASLRKLTYLKPESLFYSHFGMADQAEKRLQMYSEQLKLWARITEEGVRNRDSIEEITRRIFEKDKMVHRIRSFVEANQILMKTGIGNSVQGFVDFAEKSRLNSSVVSKSNS